MNIKYHYDVLQGSQEWHDLRTGIITASEMKLILTATLKTANNDKSRSHDFEIVAQRAMNFTEETFPTSAMERRQFEEIYAKDLYSEHIEGVRECGFITNDEFGFVLGSSPDGLVGEDGMIEVKSRCQKHQAKTVINNEMPDEYMLQVQSGLLVSGRKWCDFISYSNGMPMFIKRVYPDKDVHAKIIEAATLFEARAKENMAAYVANSAGLIPTERRDHDTGATITPSNNAQV